MNPPINQPTTSQVPNAAVAQPQAGAPVVESLERALAAIQIVGAGGASAREQELLQKSMNRMATSAERAELQKIWDSASVTASVQSAMSPSEPMAKAMGMDTGGFLTGIHAGVSDGLLHVAENLEKSMGFNVQSASAFAKGMIDIGNAVIDLHKQQSAYQQKMDAHLERIEKAMTLPAHAARAATTQQGWNPQVFNGGALIPSQVQQPQGQQQAQGQQPTEELRRSMFAGQPAPNGAPAGAQAQGQQQPGVLQKGEVLDLMTLMHRAQLEKSYQPQCGEDIMSAIGEYEASWSISSGMQQDVLNFRQHLLRQGRTG